MHDYLDTIGIDFAGPFDTSVRGNKYLLIITDHATKWVTVAPTPDCSAASASDAVLAFIASHGWPRRIVSKGGALPAR